MEDAEKKPARPPNDYALFVKDQYHALQQANPEKDNQEIMALVADAWQKKKVKRRTSPNSTKRTSQSS
jgi:hypothetical protein